MTITCDKCKEIIIEDTKYNNWLSLMNFLEFLQLEELIYQETYETMVDRLMTFKTYAFEKYYEDQRDANLKEMMINRIRELATKHKLVIDYDSIKNLNDSELIRLFESEIKKNREAK